MAKVHDTLGAADGARNIFENRIKDIKTPLTFLYGHSRYSVTQFPCRYGDVVFTALLQSCYTVTLSLVVILPLFSLFSAKQPNLNCHSNV